MEILRHIRLALWGLFLLCSAEMFAQITAAEEAYKELDLFLAAPSLVNLNNFDIAIKQYKPVNADDSIAKVISLCQVGFHQQRFSQLAAAIKNYEEAKKLFGSTDLAVYDMVNSCYIPLGNLYTKTNALGEAESTIKEYILIAQSQNRKEEELKGLLNLSIVMQSKGSFQQAILILEEGIRLAPNDRRFELSLANNYLSVGRLTDAQEILNEIREIDPLSISALRLNAKVQLQKNEGEAALSSLRLVQQIFQNKGEPPARDMAKLYLSIAQTEMRLKENSNAKSTLKDLFKTLIPAFSESQNIPMEEQLFPENTLIDALDLQATVLTSENDFIGAYAAYQRAFQVQDMLNTSSLLQDSKLIQQTNQKVRSENCLQLLFNLYQNSKGDTTWLREAIIVDDRSKSPVLKEARDWQKIISRHGDKELTRKISEVQQRLTQLQLQIDAASNSYSLDQAKLKALHTAYNETMLEQRILHAEFRKQYPSEFSKTDISLFELQERAKRKDETVISYFIGRNTIFQLIISEGRTSFNRLAKDPASRDAFLKSCIEFNRFFETPSIINNNPGLFAQKSNELFEKLDIPSVERLVIIPDGILSFVPMSALLKGPTQEMSFEKMPFLIKDTEVSYKLSFTSDGESIGRHISEPAVLGVFPVFRNTNKELSYSVQEAAAIEEVVTTNLLMEEKATTLQFLQEFENYNTIHISTHANGGTFTRPAIIEFADRTMSIEELYGYQFNKDLVVLSACETGVGKVLKGEGALSIARAFQYTGTANVLFSQWKVNDLSTAQLMEGFYKNYAKSGSKNTSLHKAKLNYLQNPELDNIKKSPYYWAGFVYYGNTDVGATFHFWWLILGGLALLVFGLFFLRKKAQTNSKK